MLMIALSFLFWQLFAIVPLAQTFTFPGWGMRINRYHDCHLKMSSDVASFGNPIVKKIDKETNVAFMTIGLSGEQTQKAFKKSCELFNEEAKTRKYKITGFREGATLPSTYLYQIFGEDKVKLLCGSLLSEEIQVLS